METSPAPLCPPSGSQGPGGCFLLLTCAVGWEATWQGAVLGQGTGHATSWRLRSPAISSSEGTHSRPLVLRRASLMKCPYWAISEPGNRFSVLPEQRKTRFRCTKALSCKSVHGNPAQHSAPRKTPTYLFILLYWSLALPRKAQGPCSTQLSSESSSSSSSWVRGLRSVSSRAREEKHLP